jgi:hypothetical protein
MLVLGVFAVLELLADKFPGIDHALHAVYFIVRPVAAAILVGATVHADNAPSLYAMMAVGGLNALVVHGSAATARAASSATTLGIGNVALSVLEDVVTVAGIALAFVKPIIAAIAAIVFVVLIVALARAAVARVRSLAPRRER